MTYVHLLTTPCHPIPSARNPWRKASCCFVSRRICFGSLWEDGLDFGVWMVVSGPSVGPGTQVWERTAEAGPCAFFTGCERLAP